MVYFDDYIELMKTHKSDLEGCSNTIEQYKKEVYDSNAYRKLADDFIKYSHGEQDDSDNYYFFEFLKSLKNDKKYSFPRENGTYYDAEINLFSPYCEVKLNGEIIKMVHPRWHLIVSLCAWVESVNNHPEDENVKQIIEKNGKKKLLGINNYTNKVLKVWLEESKII